MRIRFWVPIFAGLFATSAATAWAAVTEDEFQLRAFGDLVELCSAAPADPLFTAASNFCHGFGVGVVRVLQEEDAARKSRPLFCLPTPIPTRNEVIASLVTWAKANPGQMSQPATDGVAAYMSKQFPCARSR